MNNLPCDINDVIKAATDLAASGCTVGSTYFYDSIIQLQFSAYVSAYANEVIQTVNDGIISAWEGVQEITSEHQELLAAVGFYVQNGMGVAAGAIQVEAGVVVTGGTAGWGLPLGGMLIGHGLNNIYEGTGNIYNGPSAPGVVGPVRQGYQYVVDDTHQGNMAYYSTDLLLSGLGLVRKIRTPESFQLFRNDPINYEMAYRQASKVALFFEGLVDALTIKTMLTEEQEKK